MTTIHQPRGPDAISARNIPAHVPPALVLEFNYFTDPQRNGDVQLELMALHSSAPPVFWSPYNGGHWFVTRYEDLRTIGTSHEIFSSDVAVPMPIARPKLPAPPQDMHGRDHLQHRMLLMKFLSPRMVNELEGRVREMTNGLIDAIRDTEGCEFKDAISMPLPVKIFMTLMGMDLERYKEMVGWVHDILGGGANPAQAFTDMATYIHELVERRLAAPGGDAVSMLLSSEIDGVQVTPQRVREMCNLLFIAGLDTVTNAMTFSMCHLARNPELQRQLRAEPSLIPNAVEELLRRFSFVNIPRKVITDTDILGVPMRAGDVVLCSLAAGNNDPRSFLQPERFDLKRNAKHIAFNTGPHSCVGAALARLEMRVLLEEWLRRMPDVSLVPGASVVQKGGPIMSIEALHLCW